MPREAKSVAFVLFVSGFVLSCFLSAKAQNARYADADKLFSPSVAQRFYEIAYELANAKDIDAVRAEQALVFLGGTQGLDSAASYAQPESIKLICSYLEGNQSELVFQLLGDYIDESADLEVAKKAVRYLLDQLDSREEREAVLGTLLQYFGAKNAALGSEVSTLFGLLMAEKADLESAKFLFTQAYQSNPYNKLAFSKLDELAYDQINPAARLEHLRFALGENPFNIEAALSFTQYAEQLLLYDTAAEAYEYCVDLFRLLYPGQPVPSYLYLPWAISCYNSQANQPKCLQIANQVRQSGRFDLLLEAIAGKALAKIGGGEQADQLLQAAEEIASQMLADSNSALQPVEVTAEQLAWFHCFALPNQDKAIDWANKAYSMDPNSSTAAALLAYSLAINGQVDWAETIIESYQKNQIAQLALAQIQLTRDQKDLAIETLRSAIARDPGSLEAELAKELLVQHGTEYIDPIAPETILASLRESLDRSVVPRFVEPNKIISLQLSIRGSEFAYGSPINGSIVVTNNSSEPFVISDDGLFTGRIRVDANVTGDLNRMIPNLVNTKVQPALLIEPDRSLLIPLRIETGELRQILHTHPQASLKIEFTAFIDPVTGPDGSVGNRLSQILPAKATVRRPRVELTKRYIRNRLNSLSKGRQESRKQTLQLFIGLLMEQNIMANRQPLYEFIYADWMPDMLKSAVIRGLGDDDWVVRVQTMASMLSVPLDYEFVNAVAENLNDSHWPTRLMALYLLTKSQDGNFTKVLDHYARYDSHMTVRSMAVALGGKEPEKKQPAKQPQSQQESPQ